MSYKAIGWAYDLPLRGPQKPVLVALADMADESASCFPGQERLSSMTGLSVKTVSRALVRLEAAGLIKRERRFDAFGHRTSDRYHLQLTESLTDSLPSRQSDHKAESPSLTDSQSSPNGLSDRVTTRRTTSKNHQSDITSVNPVRNVSSGAASTESDLFDEEVLGSADVAGIANLRRLHKLLAKTVDGPLSPAGAVELSIILVDRANHPVQDIDAYVATACRETPADVNRWYIECDLEVA